MDDFLGTSIQYSEQQILLLERQHAAEMEKTVKDLIASGFLDSDYESSTEESNYTDAQELTDNTPSVSEDSIESITLSPRTSPSPSPSELSSQDTQDSEYNETDEYDVSTVYQTDNASECKIFSHLKDTMLTDIKSLFVLLILMMVLPHIMMFDHEEQQLPSNGRCLHHQLTSVYIYPRSTSERASEGTKEQINMIFESKHELMMRSYDLLCDEKDIQSQSQEVPRLFLQFGTAFKSNQMSRLFKESVSHSVGGQMMWTHQLLALVMSCFGIAVFAVSNSNLREHCSINIQ